LAAAPSGWAHRRTGDFTRTSILLRSGSLMLLFTTDHSLVVDAVTVRITDIEDTFCVSLHRALGSSVRGPSCSEIDATALPSAEVRPTPHPRRSTRSSPRPHRARSSHEPGRTPPSSRSSNASVVTYARFTDMWVHPVSLRQS
jgi:hypothetical protein